MQNKNIINYILKKAIKIKCIDYLGGKCTMCGNTNIHVLNFHHQNEQLKEYKILRNGGSFNTIKPELDKCILLCSNCHREIHTKKEVDKLSSKARKETKNIFLEYKEKFECEICGYNKCSGALEFHHVDDTKKVFEITNLINRHYVSIHNLNEEVKKELDKCVILCSNCHMLKHTKLEKYNIYEKQIKEKSKNYTPLVKKVNDDILIEMYLQNISLIKISKHFNCCLTTIRDKIKLLIKKGIIQPRIARKNQYC